MYLRAGIESSRTGRQFMYCTLVRSCPEGGWKTWGYWSAASSASGKRSSYSRESGLNDRPSEPYRYDDVPIRSVTFVPEDPRGQKLVHDLLMGFLRELRDGDDPIAGGGGEVLP